MDPLLRQSLANILAESKPVDTAKDLLRAMPKLIMVRFGHQC
jgi:hypothetical protein